jgi:hypothetical protein
MPNKTIYITKENLEKSVETGEGVGPYINRLIAEDGFELKPKAFNGNACRECGQIKVAGRCINVTCKLKGKLQ